MTPPRHDDRRPGPASAGHGAPSHAVDALVLLLTGPGRKESLSTPIRAALQRGLPVPLVHATEPPGDGPVPLDLLLPPDSRGVERIAILAIGRHADALAERGVETGAIRRVALVSPTETLPTPDRLGALPTTLIQVDERSPALNAARAAGVALRRAGYGVRTIEYPGARRPWWRSSGRGSGARRAVDDLVEFLARGVVADDYGIVPGWHLR